MADIIEMSDALNAAYADGHALADTFLRKIKFRSYEADAGEAALGFAHLVDDLLNRAENRDGTALSTLGRKRLEGLAARVGELLWCLSELEYALSGSSIGRRADRALKVRRKGGGA